MQCLVHGLLLLWVSAIALSASELVMIGEDVYVGADEKYDEVVCVFCSLRIDGAVGEAVAIFGSIEVDGEVRGEAVAVLGSINVQGRIGAETVAVFGPLRIGGEVGDDAVSVLGGVDLEPGAAVGGDIVSALAGVRGLDAAVVRGDVVESEALRPVAITAAILAGVAFLLSALAFWPFVAYITYSILGERRALTVMETLGRRAGMSFLLGLGAVLSSIIAPLALFWVPGIEFPLTVAVLILAAVGYVGVSLSVGRGLLRMEGSGSAVGWGAFLVAVIQIIPLIGWIAWVFFGLAAIGAALLSGFGSSIDWLFRRAETEPIPRPARTS